MLLGGPNDRLSRLIIWKIVFSKHCYQASLWSIPSSFAWVGCSQKLWSDFEVKAPFEHYLANCSDDLPDKGRR